jgi:hypothetical protein
MALMEGDEHIALQRWRDAAAAGSTNPALYHQLALREGGRWFRQFDYYFRLPEERADELRSLLLRSIKNAPQQSVAYEILAWVESAAPRPDIANVNLVQKRFADLQDRAHTLLALAMVRIRLGDREAALSLLDDIAALGPSLHTQRSVSITRDILEGRTPQPAVGSLESVFELRSRLPSGHRP